MCVDVPLILAFRGHFLLIRSNLLLSIFCLLGYYSGLFSCSYFSWYGDGAGNTIEENSSVPEKGP